MTEATHKPHDDEGARKQAALAAIEGLTIADALKFFYERADARAKEIAELFQPDDENECDGAITSEGEDNGSWLLIWTWIPFDDTPLDKYAEERADAD